MRQVLIVDDDETLLYILGEILEELGFQTHCARGGQEALKLIQVELALDLLVTDFYMFDLSGTEVSRIARLRHPLLPVIFISGADVTVFNNEINADDRTVALQKPCAIDDLRVAINRIMP